MANLFDKTKTLFVHTLKRDWLKLIFWFFGLVAFAAAGLGKIHEIYGGNPNELLMMKETLQNPAMIALLGPSVATAENYTVGAMYAQEMILFTALTFAIVSIIHVVSRTRKEEDDGTTELIRSFSVGKLAGTSAIVIELFIFHCLVAFAIGALLQVQGISSMMIFSENLLFGATLAAQGFLWGMIALLFAQIATNASGAKGLSFFVLGIFYIMRMITDMESFHLSWLNPLAWSYLVEVYVNNHWTPILLALTLSFLLIVISFRLELTRDVGGGFLAEGEGRAYAHKTLLNLQGLALRQQRTTIFSWLIGLFTLGATYGSVFQNMNDFVKGSAMIQEMFLQAGSHYTIQEQFMTTLFLIMGLFSSVFGLTSFMRLINEEKKNYQEQLYAKPLSRANFYWTYGSIGIVLSILGQFSAIFGLFIGQYSVMSEPIAFVEVAKAGFIWLPAIFFTLALLSLFIGYLPRRTSVIWGYLLFAFFISYFGTLMNLPKFVARLDIFSYIPKIPVETMNWGNVALIVLLSIALFVVGFVGYRNRDLIG